MLNIKSEVLEGIVQHLKNATSNDVQGQMDALAQLVRENTGNAIVEKLAENCKKMQTSYNDFFVPAVTSLLAEYSTMDEFRTAIERASSNMADARVATEGITVDQVTIPEL